MFGTVFVVSLKALVDELRHLDLRLPWTSYSIYRTFVIYLQYKIKAFYTLCQIKTETAMGT